MVGLTSVALSLTTLFVLVQRMDAWWLLSQMASASLPAAQYFECSSIPGLSKKQYEVCKNNRFAMRAAANGLKEAVAECQSQFRHEKWNCTAKHGFGTGLLNVASREAAFVYALSAGAVAQAVARACAKGLIAECGCGERPRQPETADFRWAGCSDNLRFGAQFSRKFVDVEEKRRLDNRARMNLHNNRVGRKALAAAMRKQCKCHGVSGSCVTKTCWRVVPDMETFAALLKRKYERAQQVTASPNSKDLMVRRPTNSRTERFVPSAGTYSALNGPDQQLLAAGADGSKTGAPGPAQAGRGTGKSLGPLQQHQLQQHQQEQHKQHLQHHQQDALDQHHQEQEHEEQEEQPVSPKFGATYEVDARKASKSELVFLEQSPDYCEWDASNEIAGTRGRECHDEAECEKLCCGRGHSTRVEWITEPCHCKFEWCCEVKCQQCERLVQRRFCK